MYRWVIAWRWLRRLPILWVSVVGVLLGVASILVVDSIFNGVVAELRRIGRGSASDIVVQTQLMPRRGVSAAVPTDAILRTLRATDGIAGAAPRLRRPCILPRDRRLPEVVAIGSIPRRSVLEMLGVVPEAEAGVSDLRAFVDAVQGPRRVADPSRPFDAPDLPPAGGPTIPLLLGDRCAEALKLARGDVIDLMTLPDVDDETARQQGLEVSQGRFRLVGTFSTASFVEDLRRAYVPLEEMRRFARTANASSEIAVKAAPGVELAGLRDRVVVRLAPFKLDELYDRPVQLWDESSAELLSAIDNQRSVLDLCLFFIVIVAGFNLLVSLHLLVSEKLRDVGTLAAMGGSATGIASIFTALGLLVTTIGAAAGLAAGALLATNINAAHDLLSSWIGRRLWDPDVYFFQRIPVEFQPRLIGLAVAGTFGVTLLLSFIASLRAARLDPVETLRHE